MAKPRRASKPVRTVAVVELDAPEPAEVTLDRVLAKVAPPSTRTSAEKAKTSAAALPVLRTARIVGLAEPSQHTAQISFRGDAKHVDADFEATVDREILVSALKNRESVLVEFVEGRCPLIVGVLQTRIARELTLKADTITLEAERELTLRSGTAAARLRNDGDVELVGSRIAMASRGLMRVVGRLLRLN